MYIPGLDRRESDIEHSYSLAMTAWFLAPHFPELDAGHLIKLALAHDVIEIQAGDTFVYGAQEHIDSKDERERTALAQLQKDWPDFPEMTAAVKEYADKSSEEAKFVYALDKILPPMMHYLGNGRVWQEHGVTKERFVALHEKRIAKDSLIYPYYQEILAFFQDKPHLFKQS
ncbi:MAG: HD domain-containing protein [Candidatus Saccharimonadales bacterium]